MDSDSPGEQTVVSAADELTEDVRSLVDAVSGVLKRRSFETRLPEAHTDLGRRLKAVLEEMAGILRDHSAKMIALVEALAGANRLYSEKIEELSSMRRVGDALGSTLDVGETCRVAVEVLAEEVGADACFLYLIDEESGKLVLQASKTDADAPATLASGNLAPTQLPGYDLAVRAARDGEPVVQVIDADQAVCLPLVAGGKPIGVVTLIGPADNGLQPFGRRILGIIANQIAAALMHSQLYSRLIKAEKVHTIVETVVAVNHQINNPLAVVLSTVEILKTLVNQGSVENFQEKLGQIESAVYEVQDAISKLANIVEPVVEEYANGTRMISIQGSQSDSGHEAQFLARYRKLLERMREDAELRSGYEPRRPESMAVICEMLGSRMGLSAPELEELRMLCLWHDVGVEAIDEKILKKPSKLSEDELQSIREHPIVSQQLLRPLDPRSRVSELIRHHHEDVNGAGYPDRLDGAQLPLLLRIHRVVEAYIAMRSERPFRPAMDPKQAQEELIRCSGLQFDPEVVKAFLHLLAERPEVDELCRNGGDAES